MAMELARVAYTQGRKVTPWDALLQEVEALAGQVAWLDAQIERAAGEVEREGGSADDALRPGGLAYDWVVMREQRGDRLAKVSKMAIDAGVAEQLLARVELQGRLLFEAARIGLAEAAGHLLSPEQQLAVVAAIARQGVALERRQNGLELDGRVIDGLDGLGGGGE